MCQLYLFRFQKIAVKIVIVLVVLVKSEIIGLYHSGLYNIGVLTYQVHLSQTTWHVNSLQLSVCI